MTIALAAHWQELTATSYLLTQVQSILIILLVIVFQPELRRMLLVLGQSRLLRWFYRTEPSRVIDEIANGAEQLSQKGYGALIVIGREAGLQSVIESGVPLDAKVSADLLTTIFTPRSPLHDQAVVVLGETLVAARCTLPLADKVADQRLGTRHRAALGLSQETDAITVVVSEESRAISLTAGRRLVPGPRHERAQAPSDRADVCPGTILRPPGRAGDRTLILPAVPLPSPGLTTSGSGIGYNLYSLF